MKCPLHSNELALLVMYIEHPLYSISNSYLSKQAIFSLLMAILWIIERKDFNDFFRYSIVK